MTKDDRRPEQIIVIETAVTRDHAFVDSDGSSGTRPTPPPGENWIIADYGDEHSTRFERLRLLPARGRTC